MLKFVATFIAQNQSEFAELWQSSGEQGRCELDERAAILEYEAGFSRNLAEARAAESQEKMGSTMLPEF